MEKLEWREVFSRQPVNYLIFDLSIPMSLDNINIFCQILQNTVVLSNSLKGSPRFSMLGIYSLSERSKCIFPLQSVKCNFTKLQFALESMQAAHTILAGEQPFETTSLAEILQDAIKQYENYFQGAAHSREEWPQIQMMFFSSQMSQNFVKKVQSALSYIHLAYISKAEIDGNMYQIENIMKRWLHDYSSDSDHLRLTLGRLTLRCDTKECLLNADALPVTGQYCLFSDPVTSQHSARATPINKHTSVSKVPVYTMDIVAVVRKEGVCESLLFGHSYLVTATRCWKIDWDELERNQQLFYAVTRYLSEKGLVLLAKKQNTQITTSEKILPTGFFAFFPSRNALLVKSIATSELVLPIEEMDDKEITEEITIEVKECLDGFEQKTVYNPLTMRSGLYSYLNSTLSKRQRPSTSFVTPIVSYGKGLAEEKKRKRSVSTAEVSSSKKTDAILQNDFITASTLLKNKFSSGFD